MYPFSHPIEIRWNDLDPLNHVNNAVFLAYFEQGRLLYFDNLKWDWQRDGLLVARNEINYLRPLLLLDKPVIHLGCSRIGNKSFDVQYLITNKDGEPVADGKSVLAVCNYGTGITQPLSAEGKVILEGAMVQV